MWQSKGRVDTDLKVVPKPAEAGCGRTLSFGGYPPFAVEVAFVQDSSVEGLRDAISWVMFLSEDSRAVSMERVLSKMFGRKVVEV